MDHWKLIVFLLVIILLSNGLIYSLIKAWEAENDKLYSHDSDVS